MTSLPDNSHKLDAVKPESADVDTNMLALDRTALANERTYQAWLRTGLAALVAGLGIYKFMIDVISLWILLTIVTIFILVSVAAFIQAAWRYSHLHVKMSDAIPTWVIYLFSLLLGGCSLLALIDLLINAIH